MFNHRSCLNFVSVNYCVVVKYLLFNICLVCVLCIYFIISSLLLIYFNVIVIYFYPKPFVISKTQLSLLSNRPRPTGHPYLSCMHKPFLHPLPTCHDRSLLPFVIKCKHCRLCITKEPRAPPHPTLLWLTPINNTKGSAPI